MKSLVDVFAAVVWVLCWEWHQNRRFRFTFQTCMFS